MKVLFIAFDSGELSVRTASALANEVDTCLMLPHSQAKPQMKWLNPQVKFQPFHKPRMRQPWQQLRLMPQLIKRIKTYNPDVIHFQKGHLYFNLALLFLRQYPLVMSIHDPRRHSGDKEAHKTPQWMMDIAYKRATRVIAHNEQMKQIIVDELGMPASHIDIVPLVERGDARSHTHLPENEHQLLYFGRIWKYKGLQYLIKAEPLISAQFPNVKIVIAGRGDDFDPYRQMMVHPEKFIVHNEFVSYEKRAELFQTSSIVILPYVEATQSGVIPVAYTFSKPVIATEVGGLPAQVENNHTGYIIPPKDEKAIAEKVICLLRNRELRHQFGANGKQKLENEWSAQAVARKTIPVYQKAIAEWTNHKS